MKSRVFLLLAVCLLASGCDDSTNPLSDPQKATPDTRLAGVWRERDNGDVIYYHVGTMGKKLPRGVLGVVQVKHHRNGEIDPPDGCLLVFPTTLGDQTYLNMTGDNQQQIEKKGWKSVDSYILLKYKVEGDKLVIWRMDEAAKKRAIKAGKIKGLIEKKDGTRVVFTDTTKHLARFVAGAGDGLWNTKEPRRLERVNAANPAKTQPEGFRDLKWGQPPTADMVMVGSDEPPPPLPEPDPMKFFRLYRRPTDKLYFGNIKIAGLDYGFDKNRFCTVGFQYDDSRGNDVLAMLTEMYGKPDEDQWFKHEGRQVNWARGHVSISWTTSHCDISCSPIEHRESHDKEKAKHQKARRPYPG